MCQVHSLSFEQKRLALAPGTGRLLATVLRDGSSRGVFFLRPEEPGGQNQTDDTREDA
jgi:hypothetical protein